MIFIVHVTRLHHNNCGIKMLEVETMNSDYSLKVLGTPRIDTHLIRKEFLQVWKCSVTREQGAVLVMGMVLGWGVTETMCQCINVVQREVPWLSFQNILALKMDNGKVDIFCHIKRVTGWCASRHRFHDAESRVTCHEWRQLQMLASLLTISLSPSDQMMQCSCPLLYFTLYDISTNIRFSRLKLSSHQCQCHFVCVFSPSVLGTVFLSVVLSINLFDSVCALFG